MSRNCAIEGVTAVAAGSVASSAAVAGGSGAAPVAGAAALALVLPPALGVL
jgi:hypothetical protein